MTIETKNYTFILETTIRALTTHILKHIQWTIIDDRLGIPKSLREWKRFTIDRMNHMCTIYRTKLYRTILLSEDIRLIRTNIVLIVTTKHHDISWVDLNTRWRTEMLYREHNISLNNFPWIGIGIIAFNSVRNELTIKFHRYTAKLI